MKLNEYDMFSEHIPIKFQIKVDYTKKSIKNEINTLWNNLNNEWAQTEFSSRLQSTYAKIDESKILDNIPANE